MYSKIHSYFIHTAPSKLSFNLLYKVVTLSQKVANSGTIKSFLKILTSKGRFPERTSLNCSKFKFKVSKLTFGLGLYLLMFCMTQRNLGSLKGLIPVLLISCQSKHNFSFHCSRSEKEDKHSKLTLRKNLMLAVSESSSLHKAKSIASNLAL